MNIHYTHLHDTDDEELNGVSIYVKKKDTNRFGRGYNINYNLQKIIIMSE